MRTEVFRLHANLYYKVRGFLIFAFVPSGSMNHQTRNASLFLRGVSTILSLCDWIPD